MANRPTSKILFVDDERILPLGIVLDLRDKFEVFTAESGEHGLEVLDRDGPFDVVVSDMRMPNMDGAEFFAAVRAKDPDAVHVILSAETDISEATAAVNHGQVFRYLTKPVSPEDLLLCLYSAVAQRRLETSEADLLENTVHGCVRMLTELLGLANPAAFSRANRLASLVQRICTDLGIRDRWRLEVAAMLSQIGCIAVPEKTIGLAYAMEELPKEREKLFQNHPRVAHQLLDEIPRFHEIAHIVRAQLEKTDASELLLSAVDTDGLELGVQLLQTVVAFDRRRAHGDAPDAAIRNLRSGDSKYPIFLLDVIDGMNLGGQSMDIANVTIDELFPGMILADGIVTQAGEPVVARGTWVTATLVHQLRCVDGQQPLVAPFRVMSPPDVLRSGSSSI